MNEDAFFQNIATRLGRKAPLREAPTRDVIGAPDFWKTTDFGDVAQKFKFELEALGGEVHECKDSADLETRLAAFLGDLGPRRVGVWGGNFVEDEGLTQVLSDYEVVRWGQDGVAEFESADVSLSGCAYAIADTGTLVLMSCATRGRSVALLAPVHVVILHQSQVRQRLGEVMEELGILASQWKDLGVAEAREEIAIEERTSSATQGPSEAQSANAPRVASRAAKAKSASGLPASVHFISGPSRSSDIENDQTIGIHGPAAVIVFIVMDS